MQPFRPQRNEVRTNFRRVQNQSTAADGYVCGSEAVGIDPRFRNSDGTAVSTFISTANGTSRRRPVVDADEPDMVIMSERHEYPVKPHEANDEYYAYLWTIEGARYKTIYFGIWGLLLAVIIGVILGYIISYATHGDFDINSISTLSDQDVCSTLQEAVTAILKKQTWNGWIKLPGDMLISAMSCVVVPLIFVNVTVGVADICSLQKSHVVGWRMAVFFVFTLAVASGEGILFAGFIPDKIFRTTETNVTMLERATIPVSIVCPSTTPSYLAVDNITNKMTCQSTPPVNPLALIDIKHIIGSTAIGNMTMSADQVVFNLLKMLVTDNIMKSFAQENAIVSLVMVALPIGIALGRVSSATNNPILDLFRQLNSIFLTMIGWVINFVPIAIVFLVASSFISPEDPTFPQELFQIKNFPIAQVEIWRALLPMVIVRTNSFFANVSVAAKAMGTLTAIFFAGTLFHALVFLPILTFLTTRRNPYAYIFKLKKALNFGFGSASSLAALPMTIQAIDSTRSVSQQLTRFLIPIGTGVHLDGAAFYLSACTMYLLKAQSPAGDPAYELDATRVSMVFFAAIINSWSCAPIPHGGLFVLNTVWSSVVPYTGPSTVPMNFVWIVAMDVLLDRFATLNNILSTAIVTRIIAEQIDETYIDEQDRNGSYTDGYLQ
ncbi:dicarboxylate/amino acid:cation (Na or H) symporter (DAACS) family protein [Thraustotheca clavata]|uniref:Amino acid transporter n=1 Tax=Thraustotheca clavata TaxID=74557 RepID=A0A1V9ZID7_9STRA|nr:dicarboxylate/amino acid:cation (Na or H) symporter (DAACS) family protein [Thraustotheca clavata]